MNASKVFGSVVALAAVVVVVLIFLPKIQERLLPQPLRAWVAVEVTGEGIAHVGPVELESGTGYRLYAVLEAEDDELGAVYYTEAPRLVIGGEEVAAERLLAWDRPKEPKIRWFSVAGASPFVEAATAAELDTLPFEELFRPDWPSAWTIPGPLGDATVSEERLISGQSMPPFGTERYHVRIEVYAKRDSLLPEERFKSPAGEALPAEVDRFPAATVFLSGPLRAASELFGVTQVEPASPADAELQAAILERTERRIAFSRLTLLRRAYEVAGADPASVRWQPLELSAAPAWDRDVRPGDMLRFADRTVFLYADRGQAGVLDEEDLCFDFARGAAVRRLSQVFTGDGELSWARLQPEPAS